MLAGLLHWIAELYRPRNLYTDNWLGHGHMEWTHRHHECMLSCDVDHVIGCPIFNLAFGSLEACSLPIIGFGEVHDFARRTIALWSCRRV
jgi:hypothetical protein